MLPKFVDASDMPPLNKIISNVYTEYPLQSSVVYERQRWQPKRKRVFTDTTNTGLPHSDLIR